MLIKPKPGARLGEQQTVTHVKSIEELEDADYNPHEGFNTVPMQWFNKRSQTQLLNHCEDKDHRIPQNDDGVREIPPDQRDGKGGPVWTKK